tara:strand:- start:1979 stop:2311 length:333 start_codon:yes stop_codon:yes gene_type:complete
VTGKMNTALQPIQNTLAADQSLRLKLIRQLEKDLGHHFLEEHDKLETIFSKLCQQLLAKPGEWNTWMYRADVSETRISGLRQKEFTVEDIALLVLEREMQKVIFRSQYNS